MTPYLLLCEVMNILPGCIAPTLSGHFCKSLKLWYIWNTWFGDIFQSDKFTSDFFPADKFPLDIFPQTNLHRTYLHWTNLHRTYFHWTNLHRTYLHSPVSIRTSIQVQNVCEAWSYWYIIFNSSSTV